ncbi:MAG: TIGR04282 family arsenosugar biosynthesis glycosyltransferase [Pseudolabrys sp.]|nr:TIGR04282 family arsenosugar biosynthesis glycosyltransferase [Pseudolabrys sp.]
MPNSRVGIAVLAKAPVPGLTKTRLIPTIGAHAAAYLQERMTERTVGTATASAVGPVTLWCAPDPGHPSFRELVTQYKVTLKRQPDGDLGARMLAAMTAGPTLVIGADCPAFTPEHLRSAAAALRDGADVVLIPAEDGGYVLIGTRQPQPALFDGIAWSTASVLSDTQARIAAAGLSARELPPLWDVDTNDDLERLERELPGLALL